MHTPLVSQINILTNRQPLTILIGQNNLASGFWFTDGIGGARIIEKDEVDAGGVPCIYAFGTTERGVPNEGVAAAVVVAGVVVGAVVVFLCCVSVSRSANVMFWEAWFIDVPLTSTIRNKRTENR